MGELQLPHVFAGHTGDHHGRASTQSRAHPIDVRLAIGEECEPGKTASHIARPGEGSIIDRGLKTITPASVHWYYAHIPYGGSECHSLAGNSLANRAQRHRLSDAERIIGECLAHGGDTQRFERGHATLVGNQRSECGVHGDTHSAPFYP